MEPHARLPPHSPPLRPRTREFMVLDDVPLTSGPRGEVGGFPAEAGSAGSSGFDAAAAAAAAGGTGAYPPTAGGGQPAGATGAEQAAWAQMQQMISAGPYHNEVAAAGGAAPQGGGPAAPGWPHPPQQHQPRPPNGQAAQRVNGYGQAGGSGGSGPFAPPMASASMYQPAPQAAHFGRGMPGYSASSGFSLGPIPGYGSPAGHPGWDPLGPPPPGQPPRWGG